jgi:ring-1,2-phenylacetyl-CoA epoxidase subunit PaaE
MSAVATFLRGWFTEPPPPFELREASARWSRGRPQQMRRVLRVAAVLDETPSTRSFALSAPDGGPPQLDYRAGQHLTVLVDVGGATQRRCYSFSSSPLSGALPAITVKRAADGVVSRHLHERVHVGDTLTTLDPTGEFTLDIEADARRHVVLVAGGVGITPLISIAETVLRAEPASRVTLLTGNRNEQEIVFRARLDALAAEFRPRLVVRHALDVAPQGWDGLHGALDGAQVVQALDLAAADAFYVCGPEPMMQSVCNALEAAGVARERIRTERFAYASPAGTHIPDRAATVTFAASGRRVTARAGQTLLQAGLEAGLDLPSSCTMGGCGACKVHKRSGSVVMSEPNCLGAHERDAGYVLACCAYAETDLVIDGF